MNSFDVTALLLHVCAQLNLGDITSPPEKLTGGALHHTFRIAKRTLRNSLVSCLNLKIHLRDSSVEPQIRTYNPPFPLSKSLKRIKKCGRFNE